MERALAGNVERGRILICEHESSRRRILLSGKGGGIQNRHRIEPRGGIREDHASPGVLKGEGREQENE